MSERKECLAEDDVAAILAGPRDEAAFAALDAHVARCPECLALVATLARTASIPSGAVDGPEPVVTPSNDALARGTRVGRYEIEAMVGAGAMGAVYAAFDPALHRTVALKLVRARWRDATEWTERLLREARTMAKLAHPNIVAVHDVGTIEGRVFVAMELVEGDTLRRWLEAPRTRKEVIATFIAAARGLAAAHDAEVVHRDFKPENVLVGRDGRVLVTDFGLAREAASGDEAPGTIAGTLVYMAPEQLRGEEVDARADQFAFCVALYEALVGERPFQDGAQADLLAAIDAQALPNAGMARVPSHVRRVLRRGLARSPEDRFPSMHALLVELSRDPAARLRLVGLAVAGVLAVAAAVLVTVLALRSERSRCRTGVRAKLDVVWNPTRRAAVRDALLASKLPYAEDAWTRVASRLDAASESWAAMHVEACDATHVRAEQSSELLDLRVDCLDDRLRELRTLVDVFSRADPVVVKNAVAAAESLAPLDRCADAFALRAVAPPSPERASAVAALRDDLARAKALRDAGRERESLVLAREASRKSDALGYTPLAAEALFSVGAAEGDLREGDAGSGTLRRAADLADAAKDDRTRANALMRRLYIEGFVLHHADRVQELQGEVAGVVARLGGGRVVDGEHQLMLGMALVGAGRLDEAAAALRRAVRLHEEEYGPLSRRVASSRTGLCIVSSLAKDLVAALRECELSLEAWTAAVGPHHPDVGRAVGNIGAILGQLGRDEEAREKFERALAILEPALGSAHPSVALMLGNLGEALSKTGEHAKAIASLERELRLRERLPPTTDPRLEVVLSLLGQAYLRAGDPSRAKETFERALPEATSGETRAEIALGLASALWESGDGPSRRRARHTAADALSAAPPGSALRGEIEQWLSSHP